MYPTFRPWMRSSIRWRTVSGLPAMTNPSSIICFHVSVEKTCCLSFLCSSRRRHTRLQGDWSSDVCSSDLAEHIPEDVAEAVAAESAAAAAAARARLDSGVTVLIVGRPLVRVGEHLAGFLHLLEGLLGLPVVGIAVRVILHRQAPIGLLDLGLGRGFRYVQYLVVVALRHLRGLRGLAPLVLHLFELRIHHILAARARTAPVPRARGGRARVGGGRAALLRGIGALRDAGRGLRQRLAFLLDGVAVIALERGAQIRHR